MRQARTVGSPTRTASKSGTLSSTELDRIFAIIRFVSEQQQTPTQSTSTLTLSSSPPPPQSLPRTDSNEANTVNIGAAALSAKGKTNTKLSKPLVIPERIATPLEDYRMAATNVPVSAEAVAATRTSLQAALRDEYPNCADDIDAIFTRDTFIASTTGTNVSRFMLGNVYSLQMMHEIVPGMYVGSYHPATDLELLRRHKVTHVLCCIEVPPRFPGELIYLTVPAQDTPGYNISRYFPQTFNFIENALIKQHSAVLVHCGAGISRAPTIAAAYLIKKLRLTAVAAIELIRHRRHVASPNLGFRQQLRAYQEELGI